MKSGETVLYGLATCDTTRAARKWLSEHGIAYRFHDVRGDGLSKPQAERWVTTLGWEKVLNKSSTTWRSLPETDKANIDAGKAVALMLAHPALVKRPVLNDGNTLLVGFKPDVYARALG